MGTPSARSCIGTSERAWRKESSARLAKILLRLRRITRRWALRRQRAREKKRVTATSSERSWLAFRLSEEPLESVQQYICLGRALQTLCVSFRVEEPFCRTPLRP